MRKRRPDQPIRVLIVEDSRSQRELLVRLLQSSGTFEVVGTAVNGMEAVEATQKLHPDVIAMDIHLPVFDGYEATRQIMHTCPTPIVMISNSLGIEGRRSVEALAAGALAVLRKPGNVTHTEYEEDRVNLLTTLRLMADVPVVTRYPVRPPRPARLQPQSPTNRIQVLAIAASTGGPAAIQMLLSGLGKTFPVPIMVVQHISRGFVEALVDWLNTTLPLQIRIATHHERMQPGCVYMAPDEYNLVALDRDVVGLQSCTSQDRYCPGADTLFESVAKVYGQQAIGVILTGMGDDGARGLKTLRTRGGYTLAQDEASCIVYGMPHAAVEMQAVDRVGTVAQIAQDILSHMGISIVATVEG
jgi:two-component system chemotaxis response regulator CheB